MMQNNIENRNEPTAKELWNFKHNLALHLKDMTVKWGTYFEADPPLCTFYSRDFGASYGYTVFTSPKAGKLNVGILKGAHSPEGGMFRMVVEGEAWVESLGPVSVNEKGPNGKEIIIDILDGFLLIDKKISLDKVIDSFKDIENEAKKRNLIDEKNTVRLRDKEKKRMKMPKRSVDETFKERGTFNPVFPGQTTEGTLALYDKPEELLVIEDNLFGPESGVFLIVHKRDEDYIRAREKTVNDVLSEKGLTPEKIAEKLSNEPSGELMNTILEAKNEVERRMEKWREENE